jgi:DNA (cytosine-5)-methyltransferase 1
MRVLSLFSGIGAFEKALSNLFIDYEVVNYCEIDKYARKAYSLLHNISEDKNLIDVTQVKTRNLQDIDLITYGFPCQDISNAGYQKGFTDNNGNRTRSGLFFEALRIIKDTKPKIAIAENVKALTSKKFDQEFNIVLGSLSRLGYNNYYKVLNAKDYGIPQNRERVFIISIRQDIDKGFDFPSPFELKKRLGDVLEDNADKKYFLSEERIKSLIIHKERNKANGNGFGARFVTESDIASSLTTSPDKSAGQYLMIKQATKKGYIEAYPGDYVNLQFPNSKTRRGRVTREYANTLLCNDSQGVVVELPEDLSIRKLTPLECFRLMGFTDGDCYILKDNDISDAQLYKMAGNSIVVNVLNKIFEAFVFQYPEIFKHLDNVNLNEPEAEETDSKGQITFDDII